MAIVLRPSLELDDDDEIVIHMGAGAARHVVRAAVNNYSDYVGVDGESGAFTVSVYAAIGGVSEDEIVRAMPQKQYGVARYGDIRCGFEVWPTTDEDAVLDDQVKEVHFDVVLPDGGCELPSGVAYDDLPDDRLAEVEEILGPSVEALLQLFLPRRAK